jgi:hypothetical protein
LGDREDEDEVEEELERGYPLLLAEAGAQPGATNCGLGFDGARILASLPSRPA